MRLVTPDWKPERRLVDKAATRAAVLRERACCVCGNAAATGHHVIPRGQGGDDVPENIVALCGSGTTGCHGDVEARRGDARATLGRYLTLRRPDVVEYVRRKLAPGGDEWLRRHYGQGD